MVRLPASSLGCLFPFLFACWNYRNGSVFLLYHAHLGFPERFIYCFAALRQQAAQGEPLAGQLRSELFL